MQQEAPAVVMHCIRLGERQALADAATKPLPSGVVPPLDMCREASRFAGGGVLLRKND